MLLYHIDDSMKGRNDGMRNIVLIALTAIFGLAGTFALLAGILFTIGGFIEQESNLTSWFGGFAGFMLIGVAAILYMTALLSYIANMVAAAVERQTHSVRQPSPPFLTPAPRSAWYAQSPTPPST
jgi:hypothetical protein